DTGGIIPEKKDLIPSEIFRQAKVALQEAATVVVVVDARSELAAPDLELVRLLQKTDKPLLLAVNNVDTEKQESLVGEFHPLGIREVIRISAEHGRGVDDLLDAALVKFAGKRLTTEGPESTEEDPGSQPVESALADDGRRTTYEDLSPTTDNQQATTETRVAIIGHPNVGKSTLL